MDWLQILALVVQLADLSTACYALTKPGVYEGNLLVGRHPSCTRLVLTKAAFIAPIFVLPKGPFRLGFTIGAIGFGGVGITFNLLAAKSQPRTRRVE